MVEKKVAQEPKVEVEAVDRTAGLWDKYKGLIIGISAAVILVAGGWLIYKKMFQEPKEERAAEAIGKAQELFAAEKYEQALQGDGQNKGFLYMTKNYDGTKSGNLAHLYAGICYLKMGEFNKAVTQLKDFDTDSKQIQMIGYGRLADAYGELGKKQDAVDYYKKAGRHFQEDDFNSSEFLFRAGYLLETMGKNKEAVEVYKEIKDKFPRTEKGFSIDKYIYRLSAEKNEFSVK
jgi:tetratricopeptide (TPR) repeat protein